MSPTQLVLRLFGVQAPPVSTTVRERVDVNRAVVMARASQSIKQANELLNQAAHQLAEGDLELADLIVARR